MEHIHDQKVLHVIVEHPVNDVADVSVFKELVACLLQQIEEFVADLGTEVEVQRKSESFSD